jgi:cytochrome c oxidase subunit II
VLALFVTVLAALLAACTQEYPYNSLAPAGPVADKQADLYWLVFWIATGVFVLVEGALLFIMFRFRRRGAQDTPKQIHGNTRLEIIWTILPALLLAGIAVPTVGTIFDLASRPEGDVLVVDVTGHQWWWEIQYPQLEIVTANEIHVPTDRPVEINLASNDVIHSFSVPRLAGKQDVVPGRTNVLYIEAPQPGTYQGQCQEFCGLSHANMKFSVVADSPSDFEAWVETQRAPAAAPEPGSTAEEGLEAFQGVCIACHAVGGVTKPPPGAIPAPDLTHVGDRDRIAAGLLPNDRDGLARWLRNPPGVKPGSKMPDYNLTEDQIDALVDYLMSLK